MDLLIHEVSDLPRWGTEVAGRDYRVVASGQTTYSALALRELGVSVSVIGYVGDDAWGREIARTLRSAGVDVSGVETVERGRTALTVAAVRPDGERAFISEYACLNDADESVIDRHSALLEAASVVCLVGTFSFPGLNLRRAVDRLQQAQEEGATTVLDTGWDPNGFGIEATKSVLDSLCAVSVFLPNLEESSACSQGLEIREAARLFRSKGAKTVVVKMGDRGCYALSQTEEITQPAFPVKASDAVGAGDVFNAGFLYGSLERWELARCLTFASAVAALRVSRGSGAFSSVEEVESFMRVRNKE